MSDETDGRDGLESSTQTKEQDWDEIKDPRATKELLRKLRDENKRLGRTSKETYSELETLRSREAEREAEAERQRETKLREQQKNEELIKDREQKLSKKDETIKALQRDLESFKVTTWFTAHVQSVAGKAGISATLVRAILRDAGGGEITQFAPEENTPEAVEASVDVLRERHPELFEQKGNSGGSPLTPMLNTQTKAAGETKTSNRPKDEDQKYFEMGKKHSFRRSQSRT